MCIYKRNCFKRTNHVFCSEGRVCRRLQSVRHVLVYAGSKGGTDVVLYASKYDGDPDKIVNVCGRFDLRTGINDRFGEDIQGRLKLAGPIRMPHPNGGPDWTLTDEVQSGF